MAVYQVKREQLNDQQWTDVCRLFELARDLAKRIEERKKLAGQAHPPP